MSDMGFLKSGVIRGFSVKIFEGARDGNITKK
jgi:hypothetical protein